MSTTILECWADILLDALDTREPGATLVRFVHDGSGEHEVAVRPIDVHPTEALRGYDAPADYALGVATGGWAAPMDGMRPSAHPEAQRVFQLLLVDRNGAIVSRVRYPDGSVMTEPPEYGAVLDALRSALGIPPVAQRYGVIRIDRL